MAHLINIVIVNFGMVLQMALLRWLNSQSEEDRMLLAAVTSVQVGKELLNRITNQDKVDAYKVPAWCWSGLIESVEPHGFCVCVCVLRKSAFWVLHSSSVNILGPRRLTSVLRWRNEFWSLLLTSGLWRRPPFSEELTPRTCRFKVLNQLFFNTLLYFFVCVDFVLPLITLQAPYTHAL